MKKFAIALLTLLVAAVSFSSPVFAQEDSNRDENGKIVRGPYEKAGADANWFVSLGAGLNWTADGILSHNLDHGFGPAIDVMFGKWFCPTLGFRAGYQGIQGRIKGTFEGEEVDNRFPLDYIHADLLWNFSNTVWGYKESRIYNLVPYAHLGALVANGNNFAGGFGLLNNFRLCEHWTIYADLRGILTGGNHFIEGMEGVGGNLSLTAGVTWNIGKTGWKRASSESADANDAKEALEEAEKAEAAAAAEEETAKEEPVAEPAGEEAQSAEETAAEEQPAAGESDDEKADKEKEPNVFYFEIGQSMLSAEEAARVKDFVNNADKSKKYVVLGYADKGTGSVEFNEAIAYKRALNVGYLFLKYGMPVENIRADVGGLISGEDPTECRIVVAKEE